ncbi:MAG: HAMP domain-containing sensor histidine kinase [Bacteroidales bacterium]
MKLINHTLLFLSAILFVTVSLWAILFYFQLLKQVKSTVDEGLASHKIVIIDKLKDESPIVQQKTFQGNNYMIRAVDEDYAIKVRDSYKDTLVFSSLKNKNFPTRLLTTAFVSADGNYYELKVISPELDKGILVRRIITSLLWLYLFMFICTIIVNHFVLKKTWEPFYQVLKYLNAFRLDKEANQKLSETSIREFSLLNESIKNLIRSNIEIFISQKEFIENASHEMQTPLAIGINKLELLAGDKDLSPGQVEKIGNIIEVFQRLSGLNRSLLLLSKIENKQFIAEEALNFDEIFCSIIADFSDFAEYRKIDIKYHKEGSWVHKMNKQLAEILVMNLVKNALIYNRHNGELDITLSGSSFSIENTGEEISLPEEKLFTRFYKNTKTKNSTGLGLSIVKAIADISGVSVNYSYNGRHIFKVSLKHT